MNGEHDSFEIEDANNISDEYQTANESTSSYQSGIQTGININRQARASGLIGAGILSRMYRNFQRSPSYIRLTDLSRLNVVHQKRKREKDDLIRLNDNLAQYIEAIRFLEIQNRKLILDIQTIENSIDQSSSRLRNMYQMEISGAKKVIDEMQNENPIDITEIEQMENKIDNEQVLSDEMNHLHQINRKEIDAIRKRISENNAEIILFGRRVSDIEEEIYRYKIEASKLHAEIKHLQTEIEQQLFLRIIFQREKISLENQMKSLSLTHEADIDGLRGKYFCNDINPSQFFRNELAQTIRQLREQYDQNIEEEKKYLHNRYIISYNEFLLNEQQLNYNNIQLNRDNHEQEKLRGEILQVKNKNVYLKAKNDQLTDQINQAQILINHWQEKNAQTSNEQLREIVKMRRHLDQLEITYYQITSLKSSLEKEINTYRELLEGRHGLKVHIDRILRGIKRSRETPYLTIIPKKNLQLKKIKDLTKGIFLDTSGSTSDSLKSLNMSILQAELSICHMIEFDYIVGWNTTSSLCDDLLTIKSNGTTNPESIFQNSLTKDIFNKCDIIVFVTDGQIEHKNVTKFSSYTKTNLNKVLIICIIIQENVEDRSSINISVIAPLMFASNVLCLLFDGKTFSVILSKGSIRSVYLPSENSIDFKDIFNQMEMYEKISIPEDFLILHDDLNECIILNFDKFLRSIDLDQMILMEDNQWKIIIQYGKINNRLDEMKYFLTRMKILSNYSDLQTILKQFHLQYTNQEEILRKKILLLKERDSAEDNQQIVKLQKQLNDLFNRINEEKSNYINENLHLAPKYWKQILDMVYQQEIASYSIKHFYFD